MSTADNFEVEVGPDGGIAPAQLARHGVRPGEHLRIAHQACSRGEVRSVAGSLAGRVPPLTMEDFEAGSRRRSATAKPAPRFRQGDRPRRHPRSPLVFDRPRTA
jgi:hypothetical protein